METSTYGKALFAPKAVGDSKLAPVAREAPPSISALSNKNQEVVDALEGGQESEMHSQRSSQASRIGRDFALTLEQKEA